MTECDTERSDQSAISEGPPSWRNWRSHNGGARALGGVEVSLYSDAWFVDEVLDFGPYDFLNPVPQTNRLVGQYDWKPAAVLRASHHLKPSTGDMTVTNDDHYHGGWLYDEIAALAGLALGARIIAGPVDRDFGYGDDPLGRPRRQSASMLPILPSRTDDPLIPALFATHDLRNLAILHNYPSLNAKTASVLVKAARLYQQALRISDSAPEISWLLLVSAVEVAAGHWTNETVDLAEQLRRRIPNIVQKLSQQADDTILTELSNYLAPITGSTGKFNKFCKTFKPEPPERRPKWCRFDYDPKPYSFAIAQIYEYRSRALHGGTPFPFPMCQPPRLTGDETGVPEERPSGLAASAQGGTWITGDLPMLLHVFAHIARGTLLNWWASMLENPVSP